MPTECAFTLPNGKKCRCMATRNHAFCRHHGAPPSRRPRRDPDLWSRLACWRDLGRSAAALDKRDAVLEILAVLQALREDRIADRTAGRLLRVLLQPWDEVPLMPTPATGWVRHEPSHEPGRESGSPAAVRRSPPSSPPAAPAAPTGRAASSPEVGMLTPEQLEQWIAGLGSMLGQSRP
jgi:hypothetical protein